MSNFLVFAFSLTSFGFVVHATHIATPAMSVSCTECVGCAATKVNDDNAIPPINNGVQKIYLAPGVQATISSLDVKSGSCIMQTNPGGQWVCGPYANCEFLAKYTITSAGAQFRNNSVPCGWSNLFGGFQVLSGEIAWLSACTNTDSWASCFCYTGATNCTNGTQTIAEIKFIGHCGGCVGG